MHRDSAAHFDILTFKIRPFIFRIFALIFYIIYKLHDGIALPRVECADQRSFRFSQRRPQRSLRCSTRSPGELPTRDATRAAASRRSCQSSPQRPTPKLGRPSPGRGSGSAAGLKSLCQKQPLLCAQHGWPTTDHFRSANSPWSLCSICFIASNPHRRSSAI